MLINNINFFPARRNITNKMKTKISIKELRKLIKEIKPTALVWNHSKDTLLKVYEALKEDKDVSLFTLERIYKEYLPDGYSLNRRDIYTLTVPELKVLLKHIDHSLKITIFKKTKFQLINDIRNIRLINKYDCCYAQPKYLPRWIGDENQIFRPFKESLKLIYEYLDNSKEIKLYFKLAVLYELLNK
jgi:hypothetical protein